MNGSLIAVGASGPAGLEDLCLLLTSLPIGLAASVLIVLHRPPDQQSCLLEVLGRRSKMPVSIATSAEKLLPGVVYIGEPGAHLTVLESGVSHLVSHQKGIHRNRTVDLLFQSLADSGHPRIIGVVLSGSLDDGSRGLATIHHAGGYTMALGPKDSRQVGMPENAIRFDGPVNVVGSIEEIAWHIRRLCSSVPQ